MELARRIADQVEQPSLYVHVEVFQIVPPRESVLGDLGFNRPQSLHDAVCCGLFDDFLPCEHPGMSDGPGDVLPVQPAIVVERNGELRGKLRATRARGRISLVIGAPERHSA